MTKTTTRARKPARKPARAQASRQPARPSDPRDVYQRVTDRILALLAQGVAPWQKPWQTSARLGAGWSEGAPAWFPRSAVSKKPYRGINTWLLLSAGYDDPRWLTFKQALDLGGNVKKGEHGTKIVLWKETRRQAENDQGEQETRRSLFATEYTVFNVAQCENLKLGPAPAGVQQPRKEDRHAEAERILVGYLFGQGGPGGVAHHGDRAYYDPNVDGITLPPVASFDSLDAYYTTAFHEAGHSTGHRSRLDRGFGGTFGDHGYGKEELVAEFTASFLAACSGIERTIDNSAAYLANWAQAIQADPKLLVQAASAAQKAADLILGAQAGAEAEGEGEPEATAA